MAKKKIIILMGESGSGKDSIAKYLEEAMGIPPMVSYATRPMRECEEDGREHFFISQDEMDRIKKKECMLAWVKLGKNGYEYCTTMSCFTEPVMTYILDPDGLKNLRGNEVAMNEIDLLVLYIDVPYDERRRRVAKRSSLEEFDRRTKNEAPMFRRARETHAYDVRIINDDLDEACRNARDAVKRFLKK